MVWVKPEIITVHMYDKLASGSLHTTVSGLG